MTLEDFEEKNENLESSCGGEKGKEIWQNAEKKMGKNLGRNRWKKKKKLQKNRWAKQSEEEKKEKQQEKPEIMLKMQG